MIIKYLLTPFELSVVIGMLGLIIVFLVILIYLEIKLLKRNKKEKRINQVLMKNVDYRKIEELITPLNFIQQLSKQIKNSKNTSDIYRYNNQLNDIIEYLLININNNDLDYIDANHFAYTNNSFDIKTFVGRIKDYYLPIAKQRGINFEVQIKDIEEELLYGDDKHLLQLIISILNNSIYSSFRGEKITLRMNEENKNDNSIDLRVEVTNLCKYVDKQYFDIINTNNQMSSYEKFSKNYPNNNNIHQIYFVKRLVLLLGGKISCSVIDNNLNVTLVVPFNKEVMKHQKINSMILCNGLIVSSDDSMIDIFNNYSNKNGGDIHLATTEEETLKLLSDSKNKIDYLLIDTDCKQIDTQQLINTINQSRTLCDKYKIILVNSISNHIDINITTNKISMLCEKPIFFSMVENIYSIVTRNIDTSIDKIIEDYDFTGKRLLIVEDNIISMEISVNIFEKLGFIVEVANNGRDGCEIFFNSKPFYYDVIIMDVVMPIMDGFKASKNIRLMNRMDATSIPIIALFSKNTDEEIEKAKENGISDYISKPIDFETACDVLNKWVKR